MFRKTLTQTSEKYYQTRLNRNSPYRCVLYTLYTYSTYISLKSKWIVSTQPDTEFLNELLTLGSLEIAAP